MAERHRPIPPDNNATEVRLSSSSGTAERLPPAYWAYLRRRSLGLIRVVDADSTPATVLLSRRLVLLRFGVPRFEKAAGLERATMTIEGGMLLARAGRGRGRLRFELVAPGEGAQGPQPAPVVARGVVEGYLPRLRGPGPLLGLRTWVYAQTQLRLHYRVTRGFLSSLDSR